MGKAKYATVLLWTCVVTVWAADILRPPNTILVSNEAATGTTVNKLVKLTGAPSTGIITTAGDTGGAVGVCTSGCGTAAASASASVVQWGNVSCVFDGATTAGNYVGISATVAGDCTDRGAAYPSSQQVLGRVLSTNVVAGTYGVALFSVGLSSLTGTVTGVGTTNSLPKYTTGASGIVGDSAVVDNGTSVSMSGRNLSSDPGGAVSAWKLYQMAGLANGVGGCANANGCWSVNGGAAVIAQAASLTQDVILFPLPAKGYVEYLRIKTNVACTGATTANTGMGTTASNAYYRAFTYDIAAAVSDTNKSDAMLASAGSDTVAGTNVVASLVTTVNNVDQIVDTCKVDYWVKWGTLP